MLLHGSNSLHKKNKGSPCVLVEYSCRGKRTWGNKKKTKRITYCSPGPATEVMKWNVKGKGDEAKRGGDKFMSYIKDDVQSEQIVGARLNLSES